jgi:hypothetical protein
VKNAKDRKENLKISDRFLLKYGKIRRINDGFFLQSLVKRINDLFPC